MKRRRAFAAVATGTALALAAGLMVFAKSAAPPLLSNAASASAKSAAPPIILPPQTAPSLLAVPPANATASADEASVTSAPAPPRRQAPAPPPGPVLPVRSPAAILQALDKVTAGTLRFAAPVGQRIRYKNLVFTVKACETSGLDGPAPRASAYVVIESEPLATLGRVPAKRVFRGWMFSDSPSLNPLQHPVYDAWLIACMASAPPA